jgi:hypothetical protein
VRFRHLPSVGRIIIITVAFGVFAVAALACATSYNAIYRLVGMLGLYDTGITKAFPGLVDIAFIIAEMAAILGGIMRAVTDSEDVTRGWPYTTMWLCGGCTIAFNVWHAFLIGGRGDPLTWPRMIVASLPPILMMVAFQVLIAIVKWVMLHLGRPLDGAAALSPTARYGIFPNGQNGHAGLVDGNGATKRQIVEAHLAEIAQENPDEMHRLTAREVSAQLAAKGHSITAQTVTPVLRPYKQRGRRRR